MEPTDAPKVNIVPCTDGDGWSYYSTAKFRQSKRQKASNDHETEDMNIVEASDPSESKPQTEGSSKGGKGKKKGKKEKKTALPLELTNPQLEEYYLTQLSGSSVDFPPLLASLRTPLPVAVRVTRCKPTWKATCRALHSLGFTPVPWFPGGLAWVMPAEEFNRRREVKQWADDAAAGGMMVYQELVSMLPALLSGLLDAATSITSNTSNTSTTSISSPNRTGCASEKGGRLVLDCCAAPGSKTLHCIDLMMTESQSQAGSGEVPTQEALLNQGVVVCNDVDPRFIPAARTRKMHSPAVMLTVGNASKWPPLFTPLSTTPSTREEEEEENQSGTCPSPPAPCQLLYSSILADVPCSGDGTLRKNPAIWQSWSPTFALKLHTRQTKILTRALHHLQVGGRLVYSTCSMNPIENEAVVLAALKRIQQVHLVPVTCEPSLSFLVDLRASPGLNTWQVAYPGKPPSTADIPLGAPLPPRPLQFFSRWEEVPDALRPPKGLLRPSMFPGGGVSMEEGEEEEEGGRDDGEDSRRDPSGELAHCLRVMPHQADTGGFFLAVFTKSEHKTATPRHLDAASRFLPPAGRQLDLQEPTVVSEDSSAGNSRDPVETHVVQESKDSLESEGDVEMGSSSVHDDSQSRKSGSMKKLPHFGHEFDDLETEMEEWALIAEFHGLNSNSNSNSRGREFPTDHLMWERSGRGEPRGLSLVSSGVKQILQARPRLHSTVNGVVLHSVGTQLFEPIQHNFLTCCTCRWRPAQEGAVFLSKYMTRQRVRLPLDKFKSLVENQLLPIDQIPDDLPEVGGVVVGICPPILEDQSDEVGILSMVEEVWLACLLTGKGFQLFTDRAELRGILIQLQMISERVKAS